VTAIELMQEAVVSTYPTVADVRDGRYVPPTDEVVLVVRRNGELMACGPYPTCDVDWTRLLPTDRVYPGAS
jgi:hypothetical protein